MLKLTE